MSHLVVVTMVEVVTRGSAAVRTRLTPRSWRPGMKGVEAGPLRPRRDLSASLIRLRGLELPPLTLEPTFDDNWL